MESWGLAPRGVNDSIDPSYAQGSGSLIRSKVSAYFWSYRVSWVVSPKFYGEVKS